MGGAVLINKATGQPEWVSSAKIASTLDSGSHYSKTGTVNVTAPEGGKFSVRAQDLADKEQHAGVAPISNATQYAEDYQERKRASYDNGFDKFLAFTEGFASSATFGAADVLMDDDATRMRADVNSGWRGIGEVTGIVGPALATGGATLGAQGVKAAVAAGRGGLLKSAVKSALKNTPAGWGMKLSNTAGKAIGGKLAAGTVRQKIVTAAVEGAVESAMWSTGTELSQAVIHDKEMSAEAVLSGMVEGAVFGGAVGGAFAAAGSGIKALKGKFDTHQMKKANPLFDLDSEVSKQFRGAILGSADDAVKYGKYFDEKLAAFDALELRGVKGDYGIRREAYKAYDSAKQKYKKFLGFDPALPIPPEKADKALRNFLQKSSKKDMLKFVKVLDDLHVRTSELDDLMKPPASLKAEVDLQRKPVLDKTEIDRGVPTGMMDEFSEEAVDAAKGPSTNPGFVKARPKDPDTIIEGSPAGQTKVNHSAEGAAMEHAKREASANMREQAAQISNDLLAKQEALAGQKLPGYTAKRYDERIVEAAKMLKGEDGARFGALDTLAVAEALGVDMEKVPVVGPIADSVLKLWLFYRLGGVMAGAAVAGRRGQGKSGAIRHAIYNGFARKGAEFGRQKGGAFGAGFAYQAAYSGSKAAFEGVSAVGNRTGEMVNRVKSVVDRVLTPGIKKATKRSIAPYMLSNATYAVPVDSDPKDDYGRIEAQLSRSATDDLAMQKFLNEQFEDFRILDPGLADQMIQVKQEQLKYLYKKLPQKPVTIPMGVKWSPPPSSMVAFKETAAVFQDPDYVLQRIEDGTMTAQNRDDLEALWPTIYNQLTDTIMDTVGDLDMLDSKARKMVAMLTRQALTPGTDPWLVSFSQENYMKKRKMDESQGAALAGANSVKAGTATPGQQYGMGPKR